MKTKKQPSYHPWRKGFKDHVMEKTLKEKRAEYHEKLSDYYEQNIRAKK